jgi:hypothetical protein
MILSGLPDDRSVVLAVERPRSVPLLEAVDDLDPVDHLGDDQGAHVGPVNRNLPAGGRQSKQIVGRHAVHDRDAVVP